MTSWLPTPLVHSCPYICPCVACRVTSPSRQAHSSPNPSCLPGGHKPTAAVMSLGAQKRLTKEYRNITANPPPYITAHPSEKNILEWHCIVTGSPDTPYDGGQYHVVLVFPANYPFAPPAIRMLTPSGRFSPNTRLCLSISDFHPKSFNPAWEVSTILLGLQSFMASDEMTTGSISATVAERRHFASRTRWWNSTGGGSTNRTLANATGNDASASKGGFLTNTFRTKAGDGGALFREQWPELDAENWEWMVENNIDPQTGKTAISQQCSPEIAAVGRSSGSGQGLAGVEQAARGVARDTDAGWIGRNKWRIAFGGLVFYVLLNRLLGETS